MLQIIGHEGEPQALLLPFFPYHFGAYTAIKYWTETNPSYGQRLVHQIFNPVTCVWNKPKRSGFSDIVILLVQDNPNQMQYGMVEHITFNFDTATQTQCEEFVQSYYFDDTQHKYVVKQLQKRITPFMPIWKPKPPLWSPLHLVPVQRPEFIPREVLPNANIESTMRNKEDEQRHNSQYGEPPSGPIGQAYGRALRPMPDTPVSISEFPSEQAIPAPTANRLLNNEEFRETMGQVIDSVKAEQFASEDEQEIAQLELIMQTWEPQTLEQDQADPIKAREHTLIPIRAQMRLNQLLSIQNEPLSINDLKRGG